MILFNYITVLRTTIEIYILLTADSSRTLTQHTPLLTSTSFLL